MWQSPLACGEGVKELIVVAQDITPSAQTGAGEVARLLDELNKVEGIA